MAAETVANLLDLMKEVWTDDRCNKQFYNENRWLDKVEKTNKYTIGRQAQVPIEKSLPGGFTSHTAAGGALNAADDLKVDRSDYTLFYGWQQVEIEAAAMNQADSSRRTTVEAVDQTMESNLAAMRREIQRQAVSNQDALIAQCTTTTTSNEVELLSTGYGPHAIEIGWLRPGQLVDIGTTANETAVAADVEITDYEESDSTPSITISGSTVSTTSSHYVSIANARSGATSKEMNGLRQIVGSNTSAVGGLDPDTAGEKFWKPASVDSTTTVVSMDLLLNLQRRVYKKTGTWPTYFTTGPLQQANLYSLYQTQSRFQGDKTSAGNVESFTWNGLSINCDPDIPDKELYLLTLKDFCVVTGGKFGKPTWASEIEGSGGRLRHKQGFTSFVDAIVYPLQLAIKRRNSHAAATALT